MYIYICNIYIYTQDRWIDRWIDMQNDRLVLCFHRAASSCHGVLGAFTELPSPAIHPSIYRSAYLSIYLSIYPVCIYITYIYVYGIRHQCLHTHVHTHSACNCIHLRRHLRSHEPMHTFRHRFSGAASPAPPLRCCCSLFSGGDGRRYFDGISRPWQLGESTKHTMA